MLEVGKESKSVAMDILTADQIETIQKAITMIDKYLTVEEINYNTGRVRLGHRYINKTGEFIDFNFMSINVSAESAGCMLWEIVNAVFNRCM